MSRYLIRRVLEIEIDTEDYEPEPGELAEVVAIEVADDLPYREWTEIHTEVVELNRTEGSHGNLSLVPD